MLSVLSLVSFLLMALNAVAYKIRDNVQAFADRIKDGKCTGGEVLKSGFYSEGGGPKSEYCLLQVKSRTQS